MAEQPHTLVYSGLPPVVRHPVRHWLLVGGALAVAAFAVAVPVFALTYARHSNPSSWWGGGGRSYGGHVALFDWYSVIWIGGAFIIGGVLGFTLVRGWWSMCAVDVAGLAILLGLVSFSNSGGISAAGIFGWFFGVFGVSAGVGLRGLRRRGGGATATRLAEIALLAGIVASTVGLASYGERRPRWPGYRGYNEHFYFSVTPWWAYVGAVILGLLGVALAFLIYRGRPRGHRRDLSV